MNKIKNEDFILKEYNTNLCFTYSVRLNMVFDINYTFKTSFYIANGFKLNKYVLTFQTLILNFSLLIAEIKSIEIFLKLNIKNRDYLKK